MQRKSETILAIDVGSTSWKLCVGMLTQQGFVLERLVEVPMAPNVVREGLVLEPETVARALRTALSQAGVRQKAALVAVGGPQAMARPVRLPPMTPDVLRKSIQFEATRYLPSAAEEHLIGFEVLHSPLPTSTTHNPNAPERASERHPDEHLEVLLVAVPHSTVDSVISTLERAGVEVKLVEIQPFACLRTIHALWQKRMPSVFAMLDLGGWHTQISVVRHGTLALTRHIPIASETLSAALKGYFHFSDDEVNQVKHSLNVEELLQTGTPTENPPLRLVQPILDELIREIRRSLNYYQSQVQASKSHEGQIAQLVLTGGGALMQGIAPYFEHRLGIPVHLFNPFVEAEKGGIPLRLDALHPNQRERGIQYVIVLGNALAPLEQRQPFRLNEPPTEEAQAA
jgi:type IV pilus assembly protein PilM